MVFRLAHITDLHLTGDPDERPLLESVFISCQKAEVDHVLVTGDISKDGEAAAFRMLDEVRRDFGYGATKSTVILGNHDIPGRRAFASRFGDDHVKGRDLAGNSLRLIALDSTAVATYFSDKVHEPHGELSDDQLEELERVLENSDGRHVVVALHHHVVDVPSGVPYHVPARWVGLWGPLANASDLLALLGRHGVPLVLTGHNHVPFRRTVSRLGTRIRCDIATSTIEPGKPGEPGIADGYRIYDFRDGVLISDGYVDICDTCWEGGLVECDTCDDDGEVECDVCDEDAHVECETCDGDGTVDCPECDDEGEVPCDTCEAMGGVECGYCKGAGCGHCDGDGARTCSDCNGHGWLTCGVCDNYRQVPCEECGGSGYFECPECGENGNPGFVACGDCGGDRAVECQDCG